MIRVAILLCLITPALGQQSQNATPLIVGIAQCMIGNISPNGDTEINWTCVEENAAKAKARGGAVDMVEGLAVMLKSVRDGTAKDISR